MQLSFLHLCNLAQQPDRSHFSELWNLANFQSKEFSATLRISYKPAFYSCDKTRKWLLVAALKIPEKENEVKQEVLASLAAAKDTSLDVAGASSSKDNIFVVSLQPGFGENIVKCHGDDHMINVAPRAYRKPWAVST